jgi:hypothetical protein
MMPEDADRTEPIRLPRAGFLPDAEPPRPVVMGRPGSWAMVVTPDGVVTPSAREAADYLTSKVHVLERLGQADRISDETLAMLPHLMEHAPRHTAVEAVREILALLRVPRPPWKPRPVEADLGHPIRWYQPDAGDQGLPIAEDQPPPRPRPGGRFLQIVTPRRQDKYPPAPEPGWRARMRRELGPG